MHSGNSCDNGEKQHYHHGHHLHMDEKDLVATQLMNEPVIVRAFAINKQLM